MFFHVEYCSYKGLTHGHGSYVAFQKNQVEYCSYKGLTPVILFTLPTFKILLVEYCSYKGLTHF